MPKFFEGFDLKSFWEESEWGAKEFVEPESTRDLIESIESELGYKLPAAYIALMKTQNGGIPRDKCFPTSTPTSWAKDHIAISGIMGIGRTKTYSLCGKLGSRFMQKEWEYPEIGICICDCPSAGHDMIMLDYRKCGRNGEPAVVHVDQERDYEITFLAKDFESFIRGLVNESVFDTSAEDLKKSLEKIETGSFSSVLSGLLSKHPEIDFGAAIRKICEALTREKGYFALHADEMSHLLYDVQFHLMTTSQPVKTKKQYLDDYSKIIALGDGEFTTGGYAPDFVKGWFAKRQADGAIVSVSGRIVFSEDFTKKLLERVAEF